MHAAHAGEASLFGDRIEPKLAGAQQAFRALNPTSHRYLTRRCTEVLHEQPRKMSTAYAEPISQVIDANSIEHTALDQSQRLVDGCSGSIPGRAERCRLGAATQAWPVSRALRRCCTRIERHVFPARDSRLAYRAAIDAGCLDADVEDPVEGRVSSLHRFFACPYIEHAGNIALGSRPWEVSSDDHVPKQPMDCRATSEVALTSEYRSSMCWLSRETDGPHAARPCRTV